ncbi:MAG: RidA family protein [Bacteroidota bacterium]
MRVVLCSALCLVLVGCTSTTPPAVTHVTPAPMQEVSTALQFSQAVRVGDMVWVSGQVGFGADGIPESADDQARVAFENLAFVLAEAGASLDDIVELTTYHVSMDDFGAFMAVKSEFIAAPFPAWTAVEVSGLAEPSLLVEVKAVAVVGSGSTR